MTVGPDDFAWLARLHGLVATLGIAVLAHPVVLLRTRRAAAPLTLLTAELGAALLAAPFALGWWLYPVYTQRVKVALWTHHPDAVLRFETKEHLAAMATALAVGGALTLRVAGRDRPGREAAWALLACGWVMGLGAAVLGVYVAGRAHPAW